ncbi:cubilin, partial [Elysia marginata]
MGTSSGQVRAGWVILLLVLLQLHTTDNQRVRKKREILPNQPRIITQNGHLVFQSGINHNISFKAGSGGGFLLNNIDLVAAVSQAENIRKKVDDLSTSFDSASADFNSRIQSIEKSAKEKDQTNTESYKKLSKQVADVTQNNKEAKTDLQEKISSLKSKLSEKASASDVNDRLAGVTKRVQTLETKTTDKSSSGELTVEAFKNLRKQVQDLESSVKTILKLLNTDECASNPCLHGATCVDKYNGYKCICPKNYQGPRCSTDVNECSLYTGTPQGCQHGATCINTEGSFKCQCTSNYHGVLCSTIHNDCASASSSELCGHGTCHNQKRTGTQAKYKCLCEPGWTTSGSDPACTSDIDECKAGIAAFRISVLRLGRLGCFSNPRCYQGDGKTCKYVGRCSTNNGGCHPMATCSEDGSCTCMSGYVGSGHGANGCVRQFMAAACSSSPCKNQGTCEPHGTSGFTCKCLPGFSGPTCTGIVNGCNSNPCKNGGTCNPRPHGLFTCTCTSDFMGVQCEKSQSACGGHLSDGSNNKIKMTKNYINQDCVWTVAVGFGKVIVFVIGHMDFKQQMDCSMDYLEIRDGKTPGAASLGKYCKESDEGKYIESTGPYAFVRFHGGSSKTDSKFVLTYHTKKGCGHHLRGNKAPLQSLSVYPKPTLCVWVIETDQSTQVKLHFESFNLESTAGCDSVFLTVREGINDTANELGTFCGKMSIAPLVSRSNFMVLEFHTDQTMTGSGFRARWETGCGGHFLGMSDQIVSPGWPGNYPKNVKCLYKITVPELHSVVLKITFFDLQAEEYCSHDHLKFYDGEDENAPLIKPTLCGPLVKRTIRSSGESLTAEFESDSHKTHRGFSALYWAKNVSGDPDCGGQIAYNGGEGGVVKREPDSDTIPGTLCDWTIEVSPEFVIRLEFSDFHFPKLTDGRCGPAGMSVQDVVTEEKETKYRSFGTFCGTDAHMISSFTSTGHTMKLTMTAQNNSLEQYFRASFTVLNGSSDCGGDLTSASGVIKSPNYPHSYPHNIQCVWTITVPQGHQIRLNVTSFDTQGHSNCKYDKLEIRNGGFSTSPLFRTYCGKRIFYTPIISHSNRLYLKFATDEKLFGKGFQISYDSGATGCGGDMSSPSGGFTSPNYPGEYYHNVDCIWTITVSRGSSVTLSFETFELQQHKSCMFDFVE